MKKLYDFVSKKPFSRYCDYIDWRGDSSFEFSLTYRSGSNPAEEFFRVTETDNSITLSDNGHTFEHLKKIFDFSDSKDIMRIKNMLKKFDMRKEDNEFVCDIDPARDIMGQILRFLQGIHFMYDFKLFY